jgi:predicted ATPase
MVKRYVLTGAPGSGKTTLLHALRARGHAVVDEAATEVMAGQHALGIKSPWTRPEFVDLIVTRQHAQRVTADSMQAPVQLYDRCPICTLALVRFLEQPVTATLADEVDEVLREQLFEPVVFFVRLLGFIESTVARRISYEQSVAFERVHEEVYREHGFDLVDVPAASVNERVALIETHVTR